MAQSARVQRMIARLPYSALLALPHLRPRPAALLLVGCSSETDDSAVPVHPKRTEPVSTSAATAIPELDANAPRRTPGTPLTFPTPEGWMSETPANAMRKAQFGLPRAESDDQDASVIVFFFGSAGGSLQMNMQRWASQFEQPDGGVPMDRMTHTQRTVNGMPVAEFELAGTYVAETFPGSGERVHHEGWRMLASVIESDHGPYYVKLVGPAATTSRWEASYRAFVGGVR